MKLQPYNHQAVVFFPEPCDSNTRVTSATFKYRICQPPSRHSNTFLLEMDKWGRGGTFTLTPTSKQSQECEGRGFSSKLRSDKRLQYFTLASCPVDTRQGSAVKREACKDTTTEVLLLSCLFSLLD